MIESSSIARNLEQPENSGSGDPNQSASRNLKILMIERSSSLRAVRMAAALRGRGHAVSLACLDNEPGQGLLSAEWDAFDKVIPIESPGQLWQTAAQYDVLHCLDRSGSLTVLSLGGARPVVHDVSGLGCVEPVTEGLAIRAADGCVYATPLLMKAAQSMYAPEGPGLVLPTMASRQGAGDAQAKLSASNGATYLAVLACGKTLDAQSSDLLGSLASQGLNIRLFCLDPSNEFTTYFASVPNIELSGCLPPAALHAELSRCDAGLVLCSDGDDIGQIELGGELFEYVAAGLPVLTPDTAAYKAFLSRYPVGRTYAGVLGLSQAAREMVSGGNAPAADCLPFMEDEIGRLERLYMRAMASRRRRGPGTVLKLNRQQMAAPPATAMEFESAQLMDIVAQMAAAPGLAG